MRKRRKRIRHMRAKIYAVDACMIALAISTTGMISKPRTAVQAEPITAARTAIYLADEELQVQTEKTVARDVTEAESDAKSTLIASRDWGIEDSEILEQIAMAEAEGEGVEGKALVMLVVLNRVWSDGFPNSVRDVVFQEGQFSPVENGRYFEVVPDEECREAEEMILHGWDESQGALYFASTDYEHEWHENNLEYLFTVGHHDFYK